MEDKIKQIAEGKTSLGIEFGSTRIKAVLIGEDFAPLASGGHEWENRLADGLWTYSLEEVISGLQKAYASLVQEVKSKYGVVPKTVGAIGVSAMMHGYLVFDKAGKLLVPFRTWRNNNAAPAAKLLSQAFGCHIPARWSVAHLYQAVLNGEEHVRDIAFQTTLEGFVHLLLTGEKVIGVGEASGMFPIDADTKYYDLNALKIFNALLKEHGVPFAYGEILPEIKFAGERAGTLTKEGARLLDPSGNLQAGIPFCPPEGDAGTGMVATNSVKPRTGNVSAGTSVFAMIVLERALNKAYSEIDLVTTPAGDPVAMVHCNNCTSDLNAWVNLFGEFAALAGLEISKHKLYEMLYFEAEKGEKDCGGLLSYNYVSGEDLTGVDAGRPLFVRTSEGKLTLSNFMRSHLYAAFGALKAGCDILIKEEGVKLDSITAHGGLFKTERVGQSVLASALGVPVTVRGTAGEGGAWGMALLADYSRRRRADESLDLYLSERVFKGQDGVTLVPDEDDIAGFAEFEKRYLEGLPVVREAVKSVN